MTTMRRWLASTIWLAACAALGLALAGCAEAPTAPPSTTIALLHDEAFAPPSEPIDPAAMFALSPAMHRYIEDHTGMRQVDREKQRELIQALYTKRQLKLEYDATKTRTAAEAFDAKSGNCLSLVIMTAAFAKELGLAIQYQSAVIDETWSRSGGLYFSSGHVNITVGRPMGERNTVYNSEESMTIDFLPAEEIRGMQVRPLNERTIVAMYMNNRAAETMAQGHVDDAYWWARQAILQDPRFMAAYNTLGVVYLQRGRVDDADKVLARVLEVEPANAPALSNRVMALKSLGRQAEADALVRQLARVEPDPPFGYFNRGIAAMRQADYVTARDMFAKEVDRASYYHEFQFWLGLAQLQLGDITEARKHLKLALDGTTTRGEHDIYAAKLDRINAASTQLH